MASMTETEVEMISITAPLTGFISAPGTITPADSILMAMQKLNGNAVANAIIINQKINSALINFCQSII